MSEHRRTLASLGASNTLVRAALPVVLLFLSFGLSCLGRGTLDPMSLILAVFIGLAAFWEGRQPDYRYRYQTEGGHLRRVGQSFSVGMIAITLVAIGWVMQERLDIELALRQGVWILFAFAARNVVSRSKLELKRLERAVLPLALLTVLAQGSLFVAGTERHGAKNWITLGPLSVQPGEFVKLFLVLFLAALFSRYRLRMLQGLRLGNRRFPHPWALVLGGVFLLVEATLVWQKDLGMALLSGMLFLAMFAVATGRWDTSAWFVGAGTIGALGAILAFPHVRVRLGAWLFPFEDPLGSGYQSAQSIYALASGRLLGQGWGRGEPDLIPEAATDFISVALVEELGLLGFLFVLLLLALLVGWCFVVGLHCRDEFSAFVAVGLGTVFAAQTFLVVGGCLRLIPLTGMTLPFVSYGGSSLIASMIAIGLLEKIHREQRRYAG